MTHKTHKSFFDRQNVQGKLLDHLMFFQFFVDLKCNEHSSFGFFVDAVRSSVSNRVRTHSSLLRITEFMSLILVSLVSKFLQPKPLIWNDKIEQS